MANKVICPGCKGSKIWLKGKVPTRSGLKARYICYECGRSFYAGASKAKPASKPASKPRRRRESKAPHNPFGIDKVTTF